MKNLSFVLVAIVLACASCSQTGKAKPKLGLAMRSFDDVVSVAIRRSIETEALDKADLAIIDGQGQQSSQNKQVGSFFARKLGALAIEPVDASEMGSIIGKAKAERTPIVFFNGKPADEAMRSWDKLFFVGIRESEAGAAQGEILAAFWKKNPAADRNKDGMAQFIALDRRLGNPNAALLAESCVKALGAAGIKAERLPSEAGDDISGLIAKYGGKIEAVICGDNDAALGAISAYKALGYFVLKKTMPIVGLGAGSPTTAVMDALSAGSLIGAAFGDTASEGKAVFDLAYALAKETDPAKAGWSITDAKYVWIPYKKYMGDTFATTRE
jgi:methyl-galactoside transport system substrate-binding protein